MITLKTLNEATEQEVFDQVARHLLTQNEQSVSFYGSCLYRGDEGNKCAAGCLISDDEYSESFERHTWRELSEMGCIPSKHSELIHRLQNIHDDYSIVSVWEDKLKELAKEWGLEWNVT